MSTTTINSRLLLLIKKGRLNVNSFSTMCGLQPQIVHNIVAGRGTKPSFEVLQKILSTFDDVSPDWLIHGVGDMNRASKEINKIEESKDVYKKHHKGIPLLPIDTFAGISPTTDYSVNFDAIEDRYIIPLFNGKSVDFLINIRGNSMYPKYSSGDVVACKLVSELLYVQWNKVYVVDTKSQGTMIKRLKKSIKEDHITFKSDNKDYEEFDVPKSDIRNVALVVGVIRLE